MHGAKWERQMFLQPGSRSGRRSYPVGSGDSFLAGYLFRYAQGAGIKECVRYASACGLANTYEYGPGVFDRFAVEAQLNHVNINEKGGSVL